MKEEVNKEIVKIEKTLTIGKVFYLWNKQKCHIVNLFKDNDYDLITYKVWSKHKKHWFYHTDYIDNISYALYLLNKEK